MKMVVANQLTVRQSLGIRAKPSNPMNRFGAFPVATENKPEASTFFKKPSVNPTSLPAPASNTHVASLQKDHENAELKQKILARIATLKGRYNPYFILGFDTESIELKQIKKQYYQLSLLFHPDRQMDQVEKSDEVFKLIQFSYELLNINPNQDWKVHYQGAHGSPIDVSLLLPSRHNTFFTNLNDALLTNTKIEQQIAAKRYKCDEKLAVLKKNFSSIRSYEQYKTNEFEASKATMLRKHKSNDVRITKERDGALKTASAMNVGAAFCIMLIIPALIGFGLLWAAASKKKNAKQTFIDKKNANDAIPCKPEWLSEESWFANKENSSHIDTLEQWQAKQDAQFTLTPEAKAIEEKYENFVARADKRKAVNSFIASSPPQSVRQRYGYIPKMTSDLSVDLPVRITVEPTPAPKQECKTRGPNRY